MEATDSPAKFDNVAYVTSDFGDLRILRSSIVYGANAAGKTTFISTLYFLRKWLRNEFGEYPLIGIYGIASPFMLDDYSHSEPSEISLMFLSRGKIFEYLFVFDKDGCIKENLYLLSNKGEKNFVFKREFNNKGEYISYGTIVNPENIPNISLVARNKSFLAIFSTIRVDLISEAADYLTGLEIANGYNQSMKRIIFREVNGWLSDKNNKERLMKFENLFDVGLKSIRVPQKEDSTPDDMVYLHNIYDREGNPIGEVRLNSDSESQGTKTLTLIAAKVFQTLDKGGVIFIDEMDACFHTEVTSTIMKMFNDPLINKNNAQLILTSHNVYLMDESNMRKDQVWFIEKNGIGVSSLFSLAEFEDVKEDTKFRDWYLANRFGAFPEVDIFDVRKLF